MLFLLVVFVVVSSSSPWYSRYYCCATAAFSGPLLLLLLPRPLPPLLLLLLLPRPLLSLLLLACVYGGMGCAQSADIAGALRRIRDGRSFQGELDVDARWDFPQKVRFYVDKYEKRGDLAHESLISMLQHEVARAPFKNISNMVNQANDEDGFSPLMCAASYDNEDLVLLLLQHFGADPSAQNSQGISALHVAAAVGNVGILKTLLDHDPPAQIDMTDAACWDAYLFAVVNNHKACCDLLVERGAAIAGRVTRHSDTVLHLAAAENNIAEIQRAFTVLPADTPDIMHCNIDGNTCIHVAALYGAAESLEYLLNVAAVKCSALSYVALFAENAHGLTPLHLSLCSESDACLRILIGQGYLEHTNRRGTTVLHHVISSAWDVEVADFECGSSSFSSAAMPPVHRKHISTLLEFNEVGNGNLVNKENHLGISPLLLAAQIGDVSAVTLLLKAGASVNHRCRNGRTALHYAAKGCKLETIRILAEAGCPLEELDNDGYTALLLAASSIDDEAQSQSITTAPTKSHRSMFPNKNPRDNSIDLLLSLGADVATPTVGGTMLHLAVRKSDYGAIRALLKPAIIGLQAQLDTNAVNSEGETALHEAVMHLDDVGDWHNESLPLTVSLLLACNSVNPTIVAELRIKGVSWTGTAVELAEAMGRSYVAAMRVLVEQRTGRGRKGNGELTPMSSSATLTSTAIPTFTHSHKCNPTSPSVEEPDLEFGAIYIDDVDDIPVQDSSPTRRESARIP